MRESGFRGAIKLRRDPDQVGVFGPPSTKMAAWLDPALIQGNFT